MIALVVIAVWVTAVLPSVLASGILVQIANGAALAALEGTLSGR